MIIKILKKVCIPILFATTMITAQTYTNVSLNQPQSASSFRYHANGYEYIVQNANDNSNGGTHWESATNGNEWLQIDLGQAEYLGKFKIYWEPRYYGVSYDIMTSINGTDWTVAESVTTGNGTTIEYYGTYGYARYVKLDLKTVSNTSRGYSLYEFKAYKTEAPIIPPPPPVASGLPMVWHGELNAYPETPANGDAFFHTVLSQSYIYNEGSWDRLSMGSSNSLLSGAAKPGSDIGFDGDTYLDYNTEIYFKKDAGIWSVANIGTAVKRGQIEYLRGAGVTADVLYDYNVIYSEMIAGGYLLSELTSAGIIGSFEDTRDSRLYGWAKIGSQTWMTYNLTYSGHTVDNTPAYTTGYCHGASSHADDGNCYVFGRLYTWNTATAGEGICPEEWHLPSDTEWETLANYVAVRMDKVDDDSDPTTWGLIGSTVKSDYGWGALPGTDNVNLGLLPGGLGYPGGWAQLDNNGNFWSQTEYDSDHANSYGVRQLTDVFRRNSLPKDYKFSVRCIKDSE